MCENMLSLITLLGDEINHISVESKKAIYFDTEESIDFFDTVDRN